MPQARETQAIEFPRHEFDRDEAYNLWMSLYAYSQQKLLDSLDFIYLRGRWDTPSCPVLKDLLRLANVYELDVDICLELYRKITGANANSVGFQGFEHIDMKSLDGETLRLGVIFTMIETLQEFQRGAPGL